MQVKKFESGPLSVNSYLVIDNARNAGFLIDAGGQNDIIVNYAKENQITVEYLILTHAHGDHIGGAQYYLDEFGAKLVVHQDDAAMLANPSLNFSREIYGRNIGFQADLTVHDEDHLQVGGMDLRFLHTPGHTKGGLCILVEDCLFSGDTLFQSSIGRTDFPGSSYEALRTSIHDKLFVLPDDTKVYPGHMGETSIGFERENNPFV